MDPIEVFIIIIAILAGGGIVLYYLAPRFQNKDEIWRDIEDNSPESFTQTDIGMLKTNHSVELGTMQEGRYEKPYILPEVARFNNILNIAAVGTGKTRYMMRTFVLKDIQDGDNAVVIYDPQRDLTSEIVSLCQAYGREFVIFPDCGFNPLAGYGEASERAMLLADLYGQVARSGKEGGGIYYSELAQTFVQLVIPLFEAAYNVPMTMQELLLVTENAHFREKIVNEAPPGYEKQAYLGTFGSWKDDEFRKNLTGISIFIRRLTVKPPLNNLLNQRDAPMLGECIARKKVVIIRAGGYPNTIGASLGQLFQISLQSYIEHRNETGDPMHFMSLYMDEAPMYLNDNFHTLVATSRKRRVSLFLGFQTISQLHPYENVVMDNVRTWCIHGGLGYEECDFISKNIGEVPRIVYGTNTPKDINNGSGSTSEQLLYMRQLRPEDIRRISQDKLLLLSTKPLHPREVDEYRILTKPSLNDLTAIVSRYPYLYQQQQISSYPPAHIDAVPNVV